MIKQSTKIHIKMERVIINIGDKTYKCQVAKNEEDRRRGLQGVEHLPVNEENEKQDSSI